MLPPAPRGTPPAATCLGVRFDQLPWSLLRWTLRGNVLQIHFATNTSEYLKRTVVHAYVCSKEQKTQCACVAGVQAESLPGWKGLEPMLEAAVLLSHLTRRWGQVRRAAVGVLSGRKAKESGELCQVGSLWRICL